jgi:hypothetical protein
MNTKKTIAALLMLITITSVSTKAVNVQDDDEIAAQAARARAQEEALMRAREQQLLREDKAREEWVKREQEKSESNLNRRANEVVSLTGWKNETKFMALQRSTQDLVDLSMKINDQVNASGAQSISVSFYSDLDKLEKLVKGIRKSAK